MIVAFYPGAGGNRYLRRLTSKDWTRPGISYDSFNIEQLFENRYLLETPPVRKTDHILTHCLNSDRIQEMHPNTPIVFIKTDLQKSLRREWILYGHQRFVDKQGKHAISRLEHYKAIQDPAWPLVNNIEQLNALPEKILKEVIEDYTKLVNNHGPASLGILEQLTQDCVAKINSAYEIITWHLDYYKKYTLDFSNASEIIDIDNNHDDFSIVMQKELELYSSEIFDQVWNKINE